MNELELKGLKELVKEEVAEQLEEKIEELKDYAGQGEEIEEDIGESGEEDLGEPLPPEPEAQDYCDKCEELLENCKCADEAEKQEAKIDASLESGQRVSRKQMASLNKPKNKQEEPEEGDWKDDFKE